MLEKYPEVGDVLQLQTGGPQLIVNEVYDSLDIVCIWFNDRNELQRERLPTAVLKPYQKE